MTVAELMTLLSGCDPTIDVVIASFDRAGWPEVSDVDRVSVVENAVYIYVDDIV